MSFLDSLPFERLLWLVPIFFMLHNLEEAPFMESWSKRLPLKIHPTIRFRIYSPGVITAILITLPFSFYLFRRALNENILTWAKFWILLGIAPFALVTFALISLQIGKVLAKTP
jgi:hypothetical protein